MSKIFSTSIQTLNKNISAISFFCNFRFFSLVFFSLLVVISCGDTTASGDEEDEGIPPGDSVIFTAADNAFLDDDISFTVNSNQTEYVFYVPKSSAEGATLTLTGSGSLPGHAGSKDYYTKAQSFTYEGTTYTIRGVRKPTVADGPITDIVSLDYNIEADTMSGAVFGLYASTVTGITADNVKNLTVKMTRNIESGTTEHLLAAMAGSTAVGTSGGIIKGNPDDTTDTTADDRKLLVPNTSYTLYMVYDFVNATNHLINLGTRTTAAATETGVGGTITDGAIRNLLDPANTASQGTTLTIPATGEDNVISLAIFHDTTSNPDFTAKRNSTAIYRGSNVPTIIKSLYYGNTYPIPGLADYHAIFLVRVATDVEFFAAGSDSASIALNYNYVDTFNTVNRD